MTSWKWTEMFYGEKVWAEWITMAVRHLEKSFSFQAECPVLYLVAQLCLTLCDPMDYSPSGFSVHGDSSGKNTGVGSHALFQEILATQGLNPGLLHYRQILYHLSHVAAINASFSWWLGGKESACSYRRCRFNSWVRKTSWKRTWQSTTAFMPGKFYGQRSLAGYSLWSHKESDHDLATKQ